MKNGTLFLFPIILLLSGYLQGCEGDKKSYKESAEVILSCTKCDKYVLTMNGSFIGKDIFFWESVLKPSTMVIGKDVSKLLPLSSLPSIHCPECKVICCEAVWHSSGDRLKVAYRAIAAHNRTK